MNNKKINAIIFFIINPIFFPSNQLQFINSFTPLVFRNDKVPGTKSCLLQSAQQANQWNEKIDNNMTRQDQSNKTYRSLYPPATLKHSGKITLDSIHTMYYEEYGNHKNNNTSPSISCVKVALVLHGGPGAGSFPNHARFFNPSKYSKIILYDQRGCGKSTPRGEILNNTLDHLVSDIEILRKHCNVTRWDCILGGSWGCTLALAYAQKFPSRVGALVLRGICLLRPQEVEWLFGDPVDQCTEESSYWKGIKSVSALNSKTKSAWRKVKESLLHNNSKADEQKNVPTLFRFYDYLLGGDPVIRMNAAKIWSSWEMFISGLPRAGEVLVNQTLLDKIFPKDILVWNQLNGWKVHYVNDDLVSSSNINDVHLSEIMSNLRRWSMYDDCKDNSYPTLDLSHEIRKPIATTNDTTSCSEDDSASISKNITFIPAQAMLTCYYSVNTSFMTANYRFLSNERIRLIRHIPCIAIQGAQDLICPPDTALDLHSVWPEMELRIVKSGLHSMYDPAIMNEILDATDRIGSKKIE